MSHVFQFFNGGGGALLFLTLQGGGDGSAHAEYPM